MAHTETLNKSEFVDAVVGSGAVEDEYGLGSEGLRPLRPWGNTSTRGEKGRIIA